MVGHRMRRLQLNRSERVGNPKVTVVLMNDGKIQVGYLWCALLMDLCVKERRHLGGTSVDELMKWRPSLGKTAGHHVHIVLRINVTVFYIEPT